MYSKLWGGKNKIWKKKKKQFSKGHGHCIKKSENWMEKFEKLHQLWQDIWLLLFDNNIFLNLNSVAWTDLKCQFFWKKKNLLKTKWSFSKHFIHGDTFNFLLFLLSMVFHHHILMLNFTSGMCQKVLLYKKIQFFFKTKQHNRRNILLHFSVTIHHRDYYKN